MSGTLHFLDEYKRNRKAAEYIHANHKRRKARREKWSAIAFWLLAAVILIVSMGAAVIMDGGL